MVPFQFKSHPFQLDYCSDFLTDLPLPYHNLFFIESQSKRKSNYVSPLLKAFQWPHIPFRVNANAYKFIFSTPHPKYFSDLISFFYFLPPLLISDHWGLPTQWGLLWQSHLKLQPAPTSGTLDPPLKLGDPPLKWLYFSIALTTLQKTIYIYLYVF